jgi:hypothetical protein
MKPLLIILVLIVLAGCGSNPPVEQPQPQSQASAPPQKAPDENAALAAIAAVNKAQKDFLSRNRRYALTYEELMQDLYLKEEPTVAGTGYDVKLRPAADAASYKVIATPAVPSSSIRHFFSDQSGDIHAEQGKDADVQSPKI